MTLKQRNGLSYSECGKLGAIKSNETSKKKKQERIKVYNQNPNSCKNCGAVFIYEKRRNLFCSHTCSAIYNLNLKETNGKPLLAFKCIVCGKQLKRNWGVRKFCSYECCGQSKKIETKRKIENNEISCGPTLRRFLLETKKHICELCNNSQWLGKPIPLEVDHIDGNSENNILDNLRLLCCNCHALTPTYKSKNIGKGRFSRRERFRQGKSY